MMFRSNRASQAHATSIARRSRLAALLAVLCLTVSPATADTIGTFNVTGSFQQGQRLSGTMDIDITTGMIITASLDVTGIGHLGPDVDQNYFADPYYVPFAVYLAGAPPVDMFGNLPQLVSGINVTSLIGFTGGTLTSHDTPSGDYLEGTFYDYPGISILQNGTLTLASTRSSDVPEPATWELALLGFGGIGAGVRRARHLPRSSPAIAMR